MVAPPFNGLTDNIAVAVLLLLSSLSLKFNSFIDIDEGVRCMDRETGMLVITSLSSYFPAEVVIVGICVVGMGTIFKVAEVSVGLVVTVNGKDNVVVTGMAWRKSEKEENYKIKNKIFEHRITIFHLQLAKLVGNTACASAVVFGCPGIKVLFDDELSISLIGDNNNVPNTWPSWPLLPLLVVLVYGYIVVCGVNDGAIITAVFAFVFAFTFVLFAIK